MTYKEIANMIKSFGLPYAYYQFPDSAGVSPPFVCFYFPNDLDLKADDLNYQKIEALTIEFYTDNKDFTTEATIEGALNNNGFVFEKTEAFIDSEQMFMVTYQTSAIIN